MALYHRCHYNSSGRLFDVRLGKDGSAVCDGPNPAQWTGASWNRGAPLGGERERAYIAFFTLISRKHTDSPPKAHDREDLPHSDTQVEHGKPVSLPMGRQAARRVDGGAGRGRGKKRMPFRNVMDRS